MGNMDGKREIAKWRPHHIFCEGFLGFELPERGQDFERVSSKLAETIEPNSNAIIEVTQGIDALCHVCPDCQNDRCESPYGTEDMVRKWDVRILKGLGVSYGQRIPAKELHTLIKQKAPLDFCRTRCPWREVCSVFNLS